MTLKTADIRTILRGNGKIIFATRLSGVDSGSKLINTGIVDEIVQYNYTKIDLTVDTTNNTITMTRVPAHDSPHFSSDQILRRFAPIPYQIGEFRG